MQCRIKPRNGLIVIRPIPDKEQKSASGIIIPKTAGQTFEFAEVIAIGPGVPLEAGHGERGGTDDLKVGMFVLIKSGVQGRELGQKMQNFVTLEGAEAGGNLHLINQSDILAIVDRLPPGAEPVEPALKLVKEETHA